MLDIHDHGPLTEGDLERVRSQLRDALDRLRETVERTQRVFYEMRLRVAESTSDKDVQNPRDVPAMEEVPAMEIDGREPGWVASRGAVLESLRAQDDLELAFGEERTDAPFRR
jgi:hypothetical protein